MVVFFLSYRNLKKCPRASIFLPSDVLRPYILLSVYISLSENAIEWNAGAMLEDASDHMTPTRAKIHLRDSRA